MTKTGPLKMAGEAESDGGDICKYSVSGGLVNTPSPRPLRFGGKAEWRNIHRFETAAWGEGWQGQKSKDRGTGIGQKLDRMTVVVNAM